MENLVKFETAPRPMTSGKGSFPYEEVLKSLRVLDATKSLVFKKDEINQNKMAYLTSMARKNGLGKIKRARIDGKIYIWINK